MGAVTVMKHVGPEVGPGPNPETEREAHDTAAEETASISRETSLSETASPEKDSHD